MANRYQQGGVEVVQLDERLGIDEVDTVRALVQSAIRGKLPQLVVDLRRVRLVDSAGSELLDETRVFCTSRGGSLRLAGAGLLILDILRVTGLESAFAVDADVVTAAGAYAA